MIDRSMRVRNFLLSHAAKESANEKNKVKMRKRSANSD